MEQTVAYTSLIYAMAALKGGNGSGGGTGGGTVSVNIGTVETLPAGESAYVSNSGDQENVILNFGIPQGIAGQNGANGENGIDGNKWWVSNSNPGTAVEDAQPNDYVLYNGGEIYRVSESGTYVNTNINIRGSRVIPVNTPPNPILTVDMRSGDVLIFNDGSMWRVASGVLVDTGLNIIGPAGFSPEIEVKSDTEDEYVLTITTSTGSFDTPNLKGTGTSSGTTPYAYAQNLGYSGTQEQFNTAYMNAIGLTERSTGYVVLDGGGANVDTWILDGGDADDFIN